MKLNSLPKLISVSIVLLSVYLVVTHYIFIGKTLNTILISVVIFLNVMGIIMYVLNYNKYKESEKSREQLLNPKLEKYINSKGGIK